MNNNTPPHPHNCETGEPIFADRRLYVVGLPVVVTVHDDGTVTYAVDTAEASAALLEEYDVGPDDIARVELDHARRTTEGEV